MLYLPQAERLAGIDITPANSPSLKVVTISASVYCEQPVKVGSQIEQLLAIW